MKLLEKLRADFPNESLSFSEVDDGVVLIKINNQYANASISLQGAQLFEWVPNNQHPVIWVSEDAVHKKNKSIRGGIPICWPWFGAHDSESPFPAHGFARSQEWELCGVNDLHDGSTQLEFKLADKPECQHFWPYKTMLELRVTLGLNLALNLTTANLAEEDFVLTEALHTYFNISDIKNITVEGLDECDYLDKVDDFELKKQSGVIKVDKETDRVYINTEKAVSIIDDSYKRKITVTKNGSLSTVVWNPWQDKANEIGDMGKEGFRHMICVETANACNNKIRLSSGKSHVMSVEYAINEI